MEYFRKAMKTSLALLFVTVILAVSSFHVGIGRTEEGSSPAIKIVAHALGSNKLGITANDLREKPNPKGDGVLVFVPQTRFSGTERFIIWMVIDEQAYPLNGATKNLTPNLKWPREVPDTIWERTYLNPFMANEAIEIVFGKR